ncbi:MAG: hypothetical protein LUG93_12200 [Lachnospiraceae bacterium]|nr:hypothetical protein [Lachnospiraceae bacterium]
MMETLQVRNFKKYVVEELVDSYGLTKYEAETAVCSSYLSIALKMDSELAMHDSVEYWAEYVHDELLDDELQEM